MLSGLEKLRRNLDELEAMAVEMDTYLQEDILFWNMTQSMPALTLGGYLMRQQRLTSLRHLLDDAAQIRLETAVRLFRTALQEKVVRTEKKAHLELPARIRQWEAYLREEEWRQDPGYHNYGTAVETRVMMQALVQKMEETPFRLDPDIPPQIQRLDRMLRTVWIPGDFIWPDAWKPAYPQPEYWWLYGPSEP